MNNNTITSLIIATVPAVLSYIAGTKKVAVDDTDNATTHWRELYEASKLEKDEWRSDSQSKQQQIDDLKKGMNELQSEIRTLKFSYEEKIERLEETNDFLTEENERLKTEIIKLKGV